MATAEVRGFTLWQPWAWAVAEGKKKIENRPWAPPPAFVRQRPFLAIHAGKTLDPEGVEFLARFGLKAPEPIIHSAIIGIVRLAGVVKKSDDPMFFGPVGWELEDAYPLAPIPCRGFQGLWSLPPDLLARVRHAAAEVERFFKVELVSGSDEQKGFGF